MDTDRRQQSLAQKSTSVSRTRKSARKTNLDCSEEKGAFQLWASVWARQRDRPFQRRAGSHVCLQSSVVHTREPSETWLTCLSWALRISGEGFLVRLLRKRLQAYKQEKC